MGRMPTDPLTLAIYALAIARITGLITVDALTEAPRDKIISWLDDRPGTAGYYFATLITCQWCASMWVSATIVPVAWFFGGHPIVMGVALVLAISQAVGMMSEIGR